MSSDDQFGNYVEALNALSTVENRHRDALRKAIEASTATKDRAKAQMADQQRMYDRAAKDALDAEHQLAELRSMLGLPSDADTAPTPQAGTPPELVQIRARIREIAQWATDSESTAESLLRTRERMARAPTSAQPALARETVEASPPAKTQPISSGAVVALLAVVATLAVVVLIIAR